jgi:uncharacterized C2H2 Zn-finger protein
MNFLKRQELFECPNSNCKKTFSEKDEYIKHLEKEVIQLDNIHY